jgi:hypothetical protein
VYDCTRGRDAVDVARGTTIYDRCRGRTGSSLVLRTLFLFLACLTWGLDRFFLFLRPKSVPPFFSVAVCWYDSMNPSWSVGWAHAYETPSRSVSLYHEEGGEKKKQRRCAESSVFRQETGYIFTRSFLFPSCFCRGTRLLEVIGRLSSRKSLIKQKICCAMVSIIISASLIAYIVTRSPNHQGV